MNKLSKKKEKEREIEIINMLRKITPEKKQKKVKKVKKIQTIKQNQNVILNIHSPAVQPVEVKKKKPIKKKSKPNPADDPFADARPQQPIQTSARNTSFASDFFYSPANPPFSLILPQPTTFLSNPAPIQYQQINDNFNEPQFGYDALPPPVFRPTLAELDDGDISPLTIFTNDFPNSHSTKDFITPPFEPIYEDDFSLTSPQIASIDEGNMSRASRASRSISLLSNEDQVRPPISTLGELLEDVRRKKIQSQQILDNNPQAVDVDSQDDTIIPVKKTRRTKVQMNVIREQKRLDDLQKAEAKILKEQNRLAELQTTIDNLTDRRAEALRLAGEAELQLRRDNPQTKKIRVKKKPFVV